MIFITLRGDRACKALSLGEVAAAVRLRIAGFGEGTPQQDSRRGKNKRRANFGTSVESCSEKLRRSPAPVLSANKTFQKGFATRYSGLS